MPIPNAALLHLKEARNVLVKAVRCYAYQFSTHPEEPEYIHPTYPSGRLNVMEKVIGFVTATGCNSLTRLILKTRHKNPSCKLTAEDVIDLVLALNVVLTPRKELPPLKERLRIACLNAIEHIAKAYSVANLFSSSSVEENAEFIVAVAEHMANDKVISLFRNQEEALQDISEDDEARAYFAKNRKLFLLWLLSETTKTSYCEKMKNTFFYYAGSVRDFILERTKAYEDDFYNVRPNKWNLKS